MCAKALGVGSGLERWTLLVRHHIIDRRTPTKIDQELHKCGLHLSVLDPEVLLGACQASEANLK